MKSNEGLGIIINPSLLEICQEAYQEVAKLIQKKVVNEELSAKIEGICDEKSVKSEFLRRYKDFYSKNLSLKRLLAKSWCIIAVSGGAFLKEALQEEEPHYFRAFGITLCMSIITLYYYKMFASVPLQFVGGYILGGKQAHQMALEQKFDKNIIQVERAGPRGLFRFVHCDRELEAAFNDSSIPFVEHTAMLRALFGLKNGSFDCVSISALVVLSLIRQKAPVSLERFEKNCIQGSNVDGHAFVVVNRHSGVARSIHTWNPDAIILDLWYGVLKTAREICSDSNFFFKYPLLKPSDKSVVIKIKADSPPPGYKGYLRKLENLLESKRTLCDHLRLDAIFPSLP